MKTPSQLEAHVFICTNKRTDGSRPCCADKGAVELRDKLKKLCADPAKNWKGRVRVNNAGCLDKCEQGITAVIYPQALWFTHLTNQSEGELLQALTEILDK